MSETPLDTTETPQDDLQHNVEEAMSGFSEAMAELNTFYGEFDGLEYLYPDELLTRYDRRMLKKKKKEEERRKKLQRIKNRNAGVDTSDDDIPDALKKALQSDKHILEYTGPAKVNKK